MACAVSTRIIFAGEDEIEYVNNCCLFINI